MTKTFLSNQNLIDFINGLDIDSEKKESLCLNVPQMDENERLELLNKLKDIYFLDLEKKEAIEKIKKMGS